MARANCAARVARSGVQPPLDIPNQKSVVGRRRVGGWLAKDDGKRGQRGSIAHSVYVVRGRRRRKCFVGSASGRGGAREKGGAWNLR